MKRLLICLFAVLLLVSGCSPAEPQDKEANEIEGTKIILSDGKITVDGEEISNDNSQAVYAANDIVFYPTGKDFTFGEGTDADAHEQSEADAHTVIHIAKPGRYVLSGKLQLGQIAVDLGEEAEEDPEAVVTLILNGVDITSEVAPAIIFYNVFECCSSDEATATKDVDTTKAGANVIIADDSENNIDGSYVAKIYKSIELSEDGTEVIDSKKLHKYDAAFYSKKTMNITGQEKGNGILNIKADNEGLDTELHLTINGGVINITAGNDGINTNEDNVSVTTINGGEVNILCNGKTGEGDGIDSNGWLVINGGTVTAQACATSGDAGIDSDKGIYINGGNVVASGNMLDRISGGDQTYAIFNFSSRQNGGTTYSLKDSGDKIVGEYAPENAFTILIIAGDELIPGDYTLWQGSTQLSTGQVGGMQGGRPQGGWQQMPEGEGFTPPDIPQGERPQGERPEMPEGMTPPEQPGGPFGGNENISSEASTIFTIVKGSNQFNNVGPAA